MSNISISYNGELRTLIKHNSTGELIETDAPIDNNGKGRKFSPTDLFVSSLGSCMLTIMGITANSHGFSIDGSSIDIQKIMGTSPRRVKEINININIAGILSEKERAIVIRAAKHCPVSKSIHPEINEKISFNFIA
tara:strand:+ start:228 stop:635 length:408 start_codon:yes stop_codon:yes gene_type:complete